MTPNFPTVHYTNKYRTLIRKRKDTNDGKEFISIVQILLYSLSHIPFLPSHSFTYHFYFDPSLPTFLPPKDFQVYLLSQKLSLIKPLSQNSKVNFFA